MAKKKYYVVWEGHDPGIYDSWNACQQQIKNYPGAKYKSFKSRQAAEDAFSDDYRSFIGRGGGSSKKNSGTLQPGDPGTEKIIWESLSVDAACSGNPGRMEYQGVDTRTGERFFHQAFEMGTNNIGEFLGLVHGLAWLKQQNIDLPIYSDSKIAINWVKAGKCRTKLKRTAKTKYLFELIERGEQWLAKNTFETPLLKWETADWGEIPADFGRKG